MQRTFYIIRIIVLLAFMICGKEVSARHGKGGSVTYEYLGNGSADGTSRYRITVKHYVDCSSESLIESSSYLGIFDAATGGLIRVVVIPKSNTARLQKTSFNACINPAPVVCFFVIDYVITIDLADNAAGYVLSEQECCRINNIINVPNSSNYGTTNTNTIPGAINGIAYRKNTSPVYAQRDTAIICHNSAFTIDFSATDEDGDQLAYSFCAAKAGASMQVRQPNPPAAPPYSDLPYQGGYTANAPMGGNVRIDAKTGIISGVAPDATGTYVISVCVSEYRGGVQIGSTKKEVHVTVGDCTLSGASLRPSYINCDDFRFNFKNETESFSINRYSWDFGVPSSSSDTSSLAAPAFTYPDTGTYVLKLKVSTEAGCVDSTTAKVIVYPGFNPGFTITGSCFQSPFIFNDITTARYGVVDSRTWDFGESGINTDTSAQKNPSYKYGGSGIRTATLVVSTSKGCIDTVANTVAVSDKPLLSLPFRDTLICSIDSLRLSATGNGNFFWTPNTFIEDPFIAGPLVYPKQTATYIVTLDEQGCITKDSVKVNVLDFITVRLAADTTICTTDSIRLRPVSQGLQYQWTPALGLSNPLIKNPVASPQQNTVYTVTASLGKCRDKTSVLVRTIPYPQAAAGPDTAICYGGQAQLNAVIKGSSFAWAPAGTLLNAGTLQPVAVSAFTTRYVLTVYDTLGCPKPARDTVVVTVRTKVPAFAGNDTLVVAGQPLQLHATGGIAYAWSPATSLSSTTTSDPVATFAVNQDSITYTVRVTRDDGCYADDDIRIKVFKTLPDIFVPTGFTPNGDGRNDVLKPILVGMRSLSYFRVYNRWGQLVYSTTETGTGWNGTVHGIPQTTGTFVFMAAGIDYLGKTLQRKGTVVLVK